MIKTLFWNETEHRLKMAWRLIIHTVVLVVTALLFTTALTLPVGVIVGLMGDVDLFADPNALASNPLILLVSAVAMLPAVLLTTWGVGRFIDRRRVGQDFGLKLDSDWWLDLAFGLALGAGLMALVFVIELALGWVSITGTLVSAQYNIWLVLLGQAVVFLCVGIYEEVWTRGYYFVNFAEGFAGVGRVPAIALAFLISSAVFGVFHAGNPNATVISTSNLVLAGFLLGMGMLLTGKLAIPIGLHITWNFFQGTVFGFPVSGNAVPGSVVGIEQGGPPVITGGAFGPEAGLIGVAAIALGILLTVLYVRLRYGTLGIHWGLAEPTLRPRTDAPSDA